ncbi:MAG TPA: lysine 6-aminotransferase, partial [Rudaea sp.]|nr:lysine 6-aminotransferase [Rudaea sp.]
MSIIAKLNEMRRYGGAIRTVGLPDAAIERLAAEYPELGEAVDAAYAAHQELRTEFPELLKLD